jgi:hypothetical protein
MTAMRLDDAAMADQNLKRTMGLTMATALVVGNMVGSGVFLLVTPRPLEAPLAGSHE